MAIMTMEGVDKEMELNILILQSSEEHKLFPDIAHHLVGDHLEDVEVHSFSEGSALPDDGDVAFLD